MAWSVAYEQTNTGQPPTAHAPTVADGDLLVFVTSERSGYNSTITVTDDGDSGNPWVEAPGHPHSYLPADGTLRTWADIWLKVANATDAGTLTLSVPDYSSGVQYESLVVLRPDAGETLDLGSMIGDKGATSPNVTSATTAAVVPSSDTYMKIGVGVVKKSAATHDPFSYDQGLVEAHEYPDGVVTSGMAQGVAWHVDTESASQTFTFTITTTTARSILAAYILIPLSAGGPATDVVDLYPTADGTDTDVVDEGDATTDLFASIDDDPGSPSDSDWINNTDDAGLAFFDLTDMPSDFDEAQSATILVRYRGQAFDGAGTVTLFARIYQSDETTALTDEVQVAQVTADSSFTNTSAVTFTGIVASDVTVWNGARLRLRWART